MSKQEIYLDNPGVTGEISPELTQGIISLVNAVIDSKSGNQQENPLFKNLQILEIEEGNKKYRRFYYYNIENDRFGRFIHATSILAHYQIDNVSGDITNAAIDMSRERNQTQNVASKAVRLLKSDGIIKTHLK